MDRRAFLGAALGATAALGASAALGALPASADDSQPDPGRQAGRLADPREVFRRFVERRGCRLVPAFSLVDLAAVVNGGVRFDDSGHRLERHAGRAVMQPCSRISDVLDQHRPGVLPLFTIGGVAHPSPRSPSAALSMMLSLLTRDAGLPPSGLSFTTTRLRQDDIDLLESRGFGKIRVRSVREAKQAGDGSGWFVNPVTGVGEATTAIEFTREGRTIELCECAAATAGIGLERLGWAMGGRLPSWADRLPAALRAIRAESRGRQVPAYGILAASV